MTVIDTDLPSITIVKQFQYRGNDEEWTNTYFFTGDTPASPASWKTLADNVIASEKTLYIATTEVVRAIGHEAGQSVAVWSYDYLANSEAVPGTYAATGAVADSGDTANWIRWSTDQLTSRGKPIYLRSYFHPAFHSSTAGPDATATSWQTAAQAFGDDWVDGFLDGDGQERHRAGPHGVVGLVATPSQFTTTRTLKRRGRRPT